MKRIHIKRPDIKGGIQRVKNLKPEDIKKYWKKRKERREQILEKRRNSPLAKKLAPCYKFMNQFSLVFHALLACFLNLSLNVFPDIRLYRGGIIWLRHQKCSYIIHF